MAKNEFVGQILILWFILCFAGSCIEDTIAVGTTNWDYIAEVDQVSNISFSIMSKGNFREVLRLTLFPNDSLGIDLGEGLKVDEAAKEFIRTAEKSLWGGCDMSLKELR